MKKKDPIRKWTGRRWACALAALVVCFTGICAPPVRAVEVEAEGRAAGDQPNAREQALSDALREAVRLGVGVDVLSTSGVKNFQLDFDRILTAAFGHVKTYKVLQSGIAKDAFYHVKVRAQVEPGAPGAKNTLALRQLVLLRG